MSIRRIQQPKPPEPVERYPMPDCFKEEEALPKESWPETKARFRREAAKRAEHAVFFMFFPLLGAIAAISQMESMPWFLWGCLFALGGAWLVAAIELSRSRG